MKKNFFIYSAVVFTTFVFFAESMLFPFSARAQGVQVGEGSSLEDLDAADAASPRRPSVDIYHRNDWIQEMQVEEANREKEFQAARDPAVACNAKALGDIASVLGSATVSAGYQAGVDWLVQQGGNWASVGRFLGGGEVPTTDAKAIAGQLFDRVKKCATALRENAFKIAFNDFKKRLLDSMVDDTMRWIKNGFEGGPGFYQNPGQALKNAANAAVGDVARDIGLAQLCSPFQRQQLGSLGGLAIEYPPPFSEQVSCTLTDIVGNVEDFYKDFRQGGFRGYLELVKPQNNRFGQALLVVNEILDRRMEKEQEKELEFLAYQGYKPTEECVEWKVINRATGREVARVFSISEKERYDPLVYDTEICAKKDITTPGSSVRSIADAALTVDFQYAINAGDLSPYFSAILETASKRLIDSGINGLAGIGLSRSSQGKKPETFAERAQQIVDSPDLTDEEKAAQLQPIQHLAGAGVTASRAANTTVQLALSSQKTAEDLMAQLSDTTSPSSILSLISRAETLRDQILLTIRGKSANPAPLAERTFFESFIGPGFVDEATGGLSACQSDTLNAPNCTVAQIRHTSELADAIAGVGGSFPEDEQQIQNFITEIDGVAALFQDASEDVLLGLNSKLSAIANQEKEMRARYNQTILGLMETLDGTQSIVGLKAELRSCVTYVVEKRRNQNADVYFCPQLPQ